MGVEFSAYMRKTPPDAKESVPGNVAGPCGGQTPPGQYPEAYARPDEPARLCSHRFPEMMAHVLPIVRPLTELLRDLRACMSAGRAGAPETLVRSVQCL